MKSTARIEVQKSFCRHCSQVIKDKLTLIDGITALRLFPEYSLITFNFARLNTLSTALNTLTELGYPEIGDRKKSAKFHFLACSCHNLDEGIVAASA